VPLHFLKAQIKRFGLDPELFHYRAPRKLVTCAYCGKSIEKYLCHLRSEQRYFFCNREHFRAWQKEHWGEVLNEAKKGKEVILEMRANTLKKRRVDTKWLGEKILEDGWTYARVAEELKCSKQQVKKYCDTFGIKKSQRTARWYARKRGIPQLETPDWLLEQLKNGKRGITTLAKELRVSYSFLKHQIIRLGLDPKTFCYFQPQRIETTCAYCGKPITRASYKIFRKNYRYRHSFCNREHFQLWWAQNRERILKKKQT
jgi:AraC-like DNA-binding protein